MSKVHTDSHGRNLFHALAAKNQTKPVLKCISSTPKRNTLKALHSKDDKGWTPLHTAAYYGNIKILKIYLDFSPEAAEIRDLEGNNVYEALNKYKEPPIGVPENMKIFNRLLRLDKQELVYENFDTPLDIWDIAMSGNVLLTIGQSSWSNERHLYCLIDGKEKWSQFSFETGQIPRYVACSNVHSLVITADQCYAFGKNTNGVLGFDSKEALVKTPQLVDADLTEYLDGMKSNIFGALDNRTRKIKSPLLGVCCSDNFSCVYTQERVWCWGVNKGQMLGKAFKNEVVESPVIVYESPVVHIRSVKCGEDFLVLLTVDGKVSLFANGKHQPVSLPGSQYAESIDVRGTYLLLCTNQEKLMRGDVRNGTVAMSTIWTPKHSKDSVLSYTCSVNGCVILSTKSSTYKIKDNKDITEQRYLRGVHITSLVCDPYFRKFAAVQSISAGTGVISTNNTPRSTPSRGRHDEYRTSLLYGKQVWDTMQPTDFILTTDEGDLRVHSAVLYARCPTLRDLISQKSEKFVGVPDCNVIFKKTNNKNALYVHNCHLAVLTEFIKQLYWPNTQHDDEDAVKFDTGPLLHEMNAFQRLVTSSLSTGLLTAQQHLIGCDAKINDTPTYKTVLSAASPVFEALITRWNKSEVKAPSLSSKRLVNSLLSLFLSEDNGLNIKNLDSKTLFTLWQTSDELLMRQISRVCEEMLFDMVDFELVIPLINAIMGFSINRSPSYTGLVDILARNLPHFINSISEINHDSVDLIEKIYKGFESTYEIDTDLVNAVENMSIQTRNVEAVEESKLNTQTPVPLPVQGSLATSNPRPTHASHAPSNASAPSPITVNTPTPTVWNKLRKNEPTNLSESGWVTAGKKQRTKSQPQLENVSQSLKTPVKSSKQVLSPSGNQTAPLPQKTIDRTNTPTSPIPAFKSLPKLGSLTSGDKTLPIRTLPVKNLPVLTESITTNAQPKKTKTKFSGGKGQQIDALAFAQQFSKENQANVNANASGSPWKTVSIKGQSIQSMSKNDKPVPPTRSVWGRHI